MWSVSFSAVGKSSVNGMFRFLSWVERRWVLSTLDEFELEGNDEKWTYLVQIILALLGIVNRWLVTIVPKMSRGNKAIATCSHQPFLSLFPSSLSETYHYFPVHRQLRSSFLDLEDEHDRLYSSS
jgi:hypothetical protein